MGDQAESARQIHQTMQENLQAKERREQAPIAAIHHYHCDHLGTPLALTDQAGHVVWAARLDPWGQVQEEYNPQGIHQEIRLPGQHHDRETGLYYNRHRYYDPEIGAYINQDPIGLMGGANLSRYPINPNSFIDPLGLFGFGDIFEGVKKLWGIKEKGDQIDDAKEAAEMVKEINSKGHRRRELQDQLSRCLLSIPDVPKGCERLSELEEEIDNLGKEGVKDIGKLTKIMIENTPGTTATGPVSNPKIPMRFP